MGASTFPMVPGHEITGIVSQVGTGVTRYKIGDRAAVGNFVDSCRRCRHCQKGLEQYCVEGATWTYNSAPAVYTHTKLKMFLQDTFWLSCISA